MQDRYLNEKQVAELTGISVNTLRTWRWERAHLPFLKISRRKVMYRESDVLAFMDKKRIEVNDKGVYRN